MIKPNVVVKLEGLFKKKYNVYRFGKKVGSYTYHKEFENVIIVNFRR